MKQNDINLLEYLEKNLNSDDIISISTEVVQEFEKFDEPFVFVEPLLRIMERHPDAELGQPGPLVHFLERFFSKGLENLLLDSLERKPVFYTVWMLNRIINEPTLKERHIYEYMLEKIYSNPNTDGRVKNEIKIFRNE